MKTVTFQGKDYSVSDDAKWITKDCEGVYEWENKPKLSKYGYYQRQEGMRKVSEDYTKPVCEEIK